MLGGGERGRTTAAGDGGHRHTARASAERGPEPPGASTSAGGGHLTGPLAERTVGSAATVAAGRRADVSAARRVHRVGDLVELVVEEMAVQVQGHRRRLVAEHRLHHLDVRAAGDGQRGGGVPQRVRGEAVQPGDADGGVEARAAEGAQVQHAALLRREDEVRGLLAGDVDGELLGQEPRDGDLQALVGLRRAEDRVTVDVGDRFGDQRPPAQQVEVADPQGRHLAVAHAGAGQEQDGQPVTAGSRGQVVDLRAAEEDLLPAHRPRQRHADRRVASQPAVAHRRAQNQRQHPVGVAHGRRALPRSGQLATQEATP